MRELVREKGGGVRVDMRFYAFWLLRDRLMCCHAF
jgi:hypothetical protein